ncbi:GroES-like protein [Cryphonectria parasitica EP155]|uniref:GroES-like protein n=1 Tax=Cryphonectria parasitica (strain ATCC 38755 / EP155) TaxID=660469 RepID=A0A9P5CTZ3_CRYP1|nr:GroES-like protein [Cryphonectria parasitica EP155]KAF3770207.1 GroES-like protein [Cryphonectria parasitica EP155]
MSSAGQNQAAWLTEPHAHPYVIKESPMPVPEGDEVVLRVHATGINIVDHAVQARGILLQPDDYPTISGVDVAGVVTAVGPQNTRFAPGDRVLAAVSASTLKGLKYGAFQLYTTAVEPFVAKIPDHVGFAEAAVLPLPFMTALYSLFMKEALGLDYPRAGTAPNSQGKTLVVWGGSSVVGMCAIQMAKAAGYRVAATASAHNFEVLRAIGADHVFDYHDDDKEESGGGVLDKIVAALEGQGESVGVFAAMLGFDFATLPASLTRLAGLADRLGGRRKHLATVFPPGVLPPLQLPEGVEMSFNTCMDVSRDPCGKAVWEDWLPGALADGSMKCKPDAEVVGKGLESVQKAVDLVAKGVSAKKLVVDLS